MTARLLARAHGVVLRCNGEGCYAMLTTANVYIRVNRIAASSSGWIKGGGKRLGGSGKRLDFCPTCAPAEPRRIAEAATVRNDRKVARDAKRKERDALIAAGGKNPRQ